ncbi:MAG: ribosome silencing factor [Clostridia bacterium]|nr:ribosome silencing factor [Clostridia bacterium]
MREQTAKAAARELADKQAEDTVLLDVAHLTTLADYFLIVTARTRPHMNALEKAAEDIMTQNNVAVLRNAGPRNSSWRVLDCGWLVIHMFLPEERGYYDLERLWRDENNSIAFENQEAE